MTDAGGRDLRPTADQMLARIREEPGSGAHGRLLVYLGMAPGVGKTVAMLNEGHRLRAEGIDVVIGFVETHGRAFTANLIGELEVIPRRRIAYQGVTVEEMDIDAVLKRRPTIVLVDELAHTNVPGSAREKRWQDVEVLLAAGLDVITTVNIQHLESLAGIVETITGAPVRERLPDRVLDQADQIQVVDLPPESLRARLKSGAVYPPERAERALENFFKTGNLATLRELALRKVTSAVERSLEDVLRDPASETAVRPAAERVMIAVCDDLQSRQLIRRGFRMAQGLQSELLAAFVERDGWDRDPAVVSAINANLRYAEDLGATTLRVAGNDVAQALATLAREQNVGCIVIGHSRHGRLRQIVRGSIVHRLLRLIENVDIYVVANQERW